jgi:hypothetical protein
MVLYHRNWQVFMGMFDTVYAELDCPFCGKQFRYTPMTWDDALQEIAETKRWKLKVWEKEHQEGKSKFGFLAMWAEQAGFSDIEAWIAQLDAPEHVEAHRTRRYLGLAEMQTKAFESVIAEFYVGDELPAYFGHYFIPTSFQCSGCSTPIQTVWVTAWLEIEARKLKSVLTVSPESGEPEREIHPR